MTSSVEGGLIIVQKSIVPSKKRSMRSIDIEEIKIKVSIACHSVVTW